MARASGPPKREIEGGLGADPPTGPGASDQERKHAARKEDWKSSPEASARRSLCSNFRLNRHYPTPPTLDSRLQRASVSVDLAAPERGNALTH